MLREGRQLYDWPAYADAFGWVSLERIINPEAVAHYIAKYITKRMGAKIALNDHLYYCSKGLKRAEVVFRGDLRQELNPDYINEYVSIKTVKCLDEALRYFADDNEPDDTATGV